MAKQMKALEEKNKVYQSQLNDIKEIKTQLTDQMNKEINNIANPAFKNALAYYEKNKSDLVASFLLKTLTAFITSDPKVEVNTKDAIWKDPTALQEALRNVKTRQMDKATRLSPTVLTQRTTCISSHSSRSSPRCSTSA
jgi:polyhydroxyalkanoate synthesis regulator protein